MDEKEADEILLDNTLDDGPYSKDLRLAALPKEARQSLIRYDGDSDDAKGAAAIEIQRCWRGYRGRCNLYRTVNPKVSKTAVYSGSMHHTTREEEEFVEGEEDSEGPPSTEKIRGFYEHYLLEMEEKGTSSSELQKFEQFCANYIQEWWLAQRQKNIEVTAPSPQPSPQPIVTVSPPPPPPPPKRKWEFLTERQAAVIIQKAWRRHIDIQVYQYYRDLINFKARGNPSLMLRCINPNESKYLDAASGVHVKFRLAGERFPPNIYYKIFTHRPIQDMCANSPKDYTVATVKLQMAKDVHSNFRKGPTPDDQCGWYRRSENNGWRLVSDRLIHHIMADPITWETSNKKYKFSHDKIIRRQDVEKQKKLKKIDWMKKMYKEGMLKAKSDDQETVTLIEGAAAGMVATVDQMGPDALEDWEVDELLDWTTSLNFDEYLSNWKDTATSAYSEKKVEDRINLYTSAMDPYEFSLSTGPSRFQSTQQSRNTPTSSMSGARVQAL
ncbi:uncharacterized protein C11orf65 homolog [Mizuhopecten yessoensis]|uniref:Uncharacterized protein n=1 Tax=Mizuhopecten yessoensis TaxID=6573 RepID=A0A210PUM0_MIZYE|nr:uncharacterized protein C11orf65 homolog [Mizuhopecten yessoensis]OWF40183.1 hypothetical protein KP79_PYT07383 [Mizuhopecten yessoensis]